MKPDQETTLITGASAGIGRELALVFARHGHPLILVARRKAELETLADELADCPGGRPTVMPADLLANNAVDQLIEQLDQRNLKVDILVNNAGMLFNGDFGDIPLENHLRMLQLNMAVPVALSHRLLPGMKERGHGRILNVASTSAFQPVPKLAAYGASKSFVLALSEAMSVELAGSGVTVTSVCPGFTQTDMLTGVKDAKIPQAATMQPEAVAREAYAACMAGRVVNVPGLLNRLGAELVRHPPRWMVRTVGGLLARRFG